MAPILGIIASSITGNLSTNSYESIATVTVGAGGSSTISFTSIPSTFKHLQVRGIMRDSRTTNPDSMLLTFNSDTAANYSYHYLSGDGSIADAAAAASSSYIFLSRFEGANQTANAFGGIVLDILEYANTNIYKTTRSLGGYDANGSGVVKLDSGNWRNTSAITSLTLTPANTSFVQYSSFALYGIK